MSTLAKQVLEVLRTVLSQRHFSSTEQVSWIRRDKAIAEELDTLTRGGGHSERGEAFGSCLGVLPVHSFCPFWVLLPKGTEMKDTVKGRKTGLSPSEDPSFCLPYLKFPDCISQESGPTCFQTPSESLTYVTSCPVSSSFVLLSCSLVLSHDARCRCREVALGFEPY